MSDRIAVMNAGRIEQIGTPTEIYDRPRTRFVADFIGEINLIERPGGKALAVRPEKIVLGAPGAVLDGTIDSASFLGGQTLYRVALSDGRQMLVKETNAGERPVRSVGDKVGLAWAAADGVELEA